MAKPGPVPGVSYESQRLRLQQTTLQLHYEWCKKEGRDTSWYEKEQQNSKRSKDLKVQAPSDK